MTKITSLYSSIEKHNNPMYYLSNPIPKENSLPRNRHKSFGQTKLAHTQPQTSSINTIQQ